MQRQHIECEGLKFYFTMNKLILLTFMLKIVFQFVILKECQASISSNLIINNIDEPKITSRYNQTHNEFCMENYLCDDRLNLTCNNQEYKCKCILGQIWSEYDKKCVTFEYGSCNKTIQCQDQDPNRICSDNKCDCSKGYKIRSKYCVSENSSVETTVTTTLTSTTVVTTTLTSTTVNNKRTYNQSCYSNFQCDDLLMCPTGVCKCPVGYMWSSSYKRCLSFIYNDCNSTSQCQDVDPHRVCSVDKCKCEKGYKASTYTSLCEKITSIGQFCNSHCYDVQNSICYNHNCTCSMFYEPSNDLTECRLSRCRSNSDCQFNGHYVDNAHCDSYFCTCSTGYYPTDKSCDKSSFTDGPDPVNGLNLLWVILIIPLVGFCVCLKLSCQRTIDNHRTEQSLRNVNIHVSRSVLETNAASLNSVYTVGSDLTLNRNNDYTPTYLPLQESPSTPPYDPPPTYEEAIAARQ